MSYEGVSVLNYKLLRKLGEGGFGVVFLAEHETLGRKAAVKILHPEFARNRGLVDRFFNEAKAVCAIGHRAIIDIQNFGHLEGGEPYYLMEFFPGRDLSDRIAKDGPLTLVELEAVFSPVVSALCAAHDKNIIHRDLKPENIMLLEEGGEILDVKLLDFGIAKLIDTATGTESKTGVAMGTPQFMAPEQARDSKNVDVRADVYSLGATVFNALAGRPPFVASNITDLIIQVHTQAPPRLASLQPSIPEALDAIVDRCLAKDPEARPQSIDEAYRLIRQACAEPTAAAPTPPPPAALAPQQTTKASTQEPAAGLAKTAVAGPLASTGMDTPNRGHRRLLLLGLLLVGATGAVAASVALLGGTDDAAAPQTLAAQGEVAQPADASPLVPVDAAPRAGGEIGLVVAPDAGVADAKAVLREEGRCSIYEHLNRKGGYKTSAAARKKLEVFRECLAEGQLRAQQFESLERFLSREIHRLEEQEQEQEQDQSEAKLVDYNVRVRGGAINQQAQVQLNAKTGKIVGKPKWLKTVGAIYQSKKQRRDIRLRIAVHTDSEGPNAANLQFSKRVSKAMKSALVKQGLPAAKISGQGFGEGKPLDSNQSPEGRARNRRIEIDFQVIPGGQDSGS